MKKELHILNDYKRLKVFFSQTIALSSDEFEINCLHSKLNSHIFLHPLTIKMRISTHEYSTRASICKCTWLTHIHRSI